MESTPSLKYYYEIVERLDTLSDAMKIEVLKDLFFFGILSCDYDDWGKTHLRKNVENTLKREGV